MDGPISDEGLRYARGSSSRAEVSRVRWQNTYTFGDFHGSVDRLLNYYDVHFYIANWGTVRFGVAFPKSVINLKAIKPYIRGRDPYDIWQGLTPLMDQKLLRLTNRLPIN